MDFIKATGTYPVADRPSQYIRGACYSIEGRRRIVDPYKTSSCAACDTPDSGSNYGRVTRKGCTCAADVAPIRATKDPIASVASVTAFLERVRRRCVP